MANNFSKKTLARIKRALELARKNNVEVKFVATALQWMKDDPSISIEQAIVEALAEYDL